MLPIMPLLIEVLLAGVVAYLFWMTRRQVAELRLLKEAVEDGHRPAGALDVRMVNELTSLLGEVQSAIAGVRTEWLQEKETMQQMLQQAEATATEMRVQMAQGSLMGTTLSVTSQPIRTVGKVPASSAAPNLVTMIDDYGQRLRNDGRSDRSIKTTQAAMRRFSHWLGGHRHTELTIDSVGIHEMEVYFDHLWKQGLKRSTVRRKLGTLRKFVDWARSGGAVSGREAVPVVDSVHTHTEIGEVATGERQVNETWVPPTVSAPVPETRNADPLGVDRRKAVFDLANRGFDPSAIATRTGLEQDAVRLLLMMQKRVKKTERTFFPLGVGRQYLDMDAVPDARH